VGVHEMMFNRKLLIIIFICLLVATIVIINNINIKKSQIIFEYSYNEYCYASPPKYNYFSEIGLTNTNTKDFPEVFTVNVEIIIGFDLSDTDVFNDLTKNIYELRDFLNEYFSEKYLIELAPHREEDIKEEILEKINNHFFNTERAKIILFNKLDFST
jgi:flagellar basal body-associated protein FliL